MRKSTVTLTRRAIEIDGQELRFYSGELAPARTRTEDWPDRLAKLKAAGCTAVTFYVPWAWHELEPGVFDFTGSTHPQRNLVGFLDAVSRAGLYAIPRPGPFITAEWRNGGIPDWFYELHPEAMSLTAADVPLPYGVGYQPVSYLHPAFLDASRAWFEAVMPLFAQRQHQNGGPIIQVYLDDEPSYYQLLKGDPTVVDYNPVVVGDGRTGGFYQRWLETRFGGDFGALQEAYRSDVTAFHLVQPPREALRDASELPRYLDWYYCKLDIIIEYMARLYGWARDFGIQVPLAILFPFLAQYYASDRLPREFRRRGLPIHITAECYPSAGAMGVDNLAEDSVGHIVGNTEAFRVWWAQGDGPPISIEAQASQAAHLEWHGMELYYTLLLAHGIDGFNFYMMVGGLTPEPFSQEIGRSYDVSAPISASGELRDHYWLIRRLGEWQATHGTALSGTLPEASVCLAFYPPYEPAGYGVDTLAAGLRDDLRDALIGYFGVEGAAIGSLATLLPLAGVDFAMANLEHATLSDLQSHRQIWTAGLDFMSRDVQQLLVDYVDGGGHLVLLPRVPDRDELLRPMRGPLADLFPALPKDPRPGTRRGRLTPSRSVAVPTAGVQGALISDYVDTFELPPGAEPFAFVGGTDDVCGYTVRRGAGLGTLLGFKLRYAWDPLVELKRLVNAVLDLGGVVRPAVAVGWELTASVRRGDDATFVFVANPSDIRQAAMIRWRDAGGDERVFPNLIDGLTMPRRGGLALTVDSTIPGSSARLRYATSQVQSWSGSDERLWLKLYAHPGVTGEAAIELPSNPAMVAVNNGPPLRTAWDGPTRTLTVVYRHDTELLELEVGLGLVSPAAAIAPPS